MKYRENMKYRWIGSAVCIAVMAMAGCSNDSGSAVSIGNACEDNSDCGNYRCNDGTCEEKLDIGDSCNEASDCVSGVCTDGKCASKTAQASCDNCDGECVNGRCVKDLGQSCSDNDDCKDGLNCHGGKCKSEAALGDACDTGKNYCAQGDCVNGQCQKADGSGNVDTDGDTIPDIYDRCDEDTDGDTIVNCQDDDSDGDTIPDSVEGGNPGGKPLDSDGDGIPDFLDTDSDDNGIPDAFEGCPDPAFPYHAKDAPKPTAPCHHPVDTDGDGVPDYIDLDNDGDGVDDLTEIMGVTTIVDSQNVPGRKCDGVPCEPGTPENPWDSDGDTIPDYMDTDSDGDNIPDIIEDVFDSDDDGVLDRYSLDSDSDGIPDADERNPDGSPLVYKDDKGNTTQCFRSPDCDNDGVLDINEPSCNGISGINNPDLDGDGYLDSAELAAGEYAFTHGLLNGQKVTSPKALVCDPALGVKDVFDFYFVLPYKGDRQNDLLQFIPKVSKLDLVFNVDTTQSMETAINSVKTNVGNIINKVQQMVKNSGFALTNFDDYPVGVMHMGSTTDGQMVVFEHGVASAGDLPFRVLGKISTDPATVKAYTQNPLFRNRHGADGAESGAESLYQIATGAGTSWNQGSYTGYFSKPGTEFAEKRTSLWNAGSTPKNTNAPNTWGGVDFRNGSLPVVVHTTDIYSHDKASVYNPIIPASFQYNQIVQSVNSPHYTEDLVPVLQQKGIRVITLGVPSYQSASKIVSDELRQMTTWARESNAIVPACAFNNACGNNKCCLGTTVSDPVVINGNANQCILYYTSAQADVSNYITQGVDALVKYGTYEVATRISGEPIPGAQVDTSCFIKQIVATQYVAPPNEPEKSCNPKAIPTAVDGANYNNGFKNFAPGTSNEDIDGAQLHFTVIAQNDNCVPGTDKTQVFKAYIDVVNPVTGLVFGRRQVYIIVPPDGGVVVN